MRIEDLLDDILAEIDKAAAEAGYAEDVRGGLLMAADLIKQQSKENNIKLNFCGDYIFICEEEEEVENVNCINCGRNDLPLHTSGRCGDCGYEETVSLKDPYPKI